MPVLFRTSLPIDTGVVGFDPSMDLALPSLQQLRRRRSVKWTTYPDDVLPAWVAEMDVPLAPPVCEALASAIERGDTGYANPSAGRLGEAFAGFADRRLGWTVDPHQVYPTADVVGGIRELLRLMTRPGDGVVINPPVYHPFFSVIEEVGAKVVEVPLTGSSGLDLDGMERAFEDGARIALLCSPHNPTGRVIPADQLSEIAEIAVAHDVWVLSDEIHAPLVLPGARHTAFLTVSESARRCGIALISASKAFNIAGLQSAQIVTSSDRARAVVEGLPHGATHCGHLGAIASEAAYRDGDEWLDLVIALLDANRQRLDQLLTGRLPSVTYDQPEAGYLAWLDCTSLGLGSDPAAVFLERGRVALSSGPQFGSQGAGFARLNIGTSPELVEEAVRRMASAVA